MKRLACRGCFAGAWWDLQQMSWLLGNANEKQAFKTSVPCGPKSYLASLLQPPLPPAIPPALCNLPNIYEILTRNKKDRCWSGPLTTQSSWATQETHTHTHTHKTPSPKPNSKIKQTKKRREEEKLAVACKAVWSPVSEFSQSLGLACVCILGVGTCLFLISLHAFSSCALALPLLPSCCKPPFPFKAFWHNELIFPCSLWKLGYVHESCSLRGLF